MKKTLNIVDYSSIIYLTITALLILFYFEDIDKPIFHLLARIGFIFVLFFSAYVRNKYDYGYINLVASLVPLLFLGYLYNETADFNHIFFDSLDPWISQVELNIFFFQPSVSFSETFSDFWFSELMNFGYFSYYFIIFISPVLFYFQKRELFERTLFILLTSFYFFYIFFIIFPVVGPQFYFEGSLATFTPQGFFGFMIKYIQEVGEVPTGAFPSSHVGITLIISIMYFYHLKKYLPIILVLAFFLILSTVYIKAHYVVDVIAAFFVAPLFYYIADKLYISGVNNP